MVLQTAYIILTHFSRASYGGIKMKRFYNLLIVDNLNIDDLGTMHKENRQDVKEIRNGAASTEAS